jgi:transketolase
VLARYPTVVTLEEHVQRGGLGAQVKQLAWDSSARCRLHTFALKDEFIHLYGSHDQLRRAHGLSVDQLYAAVA